MKGTVDERGLVQTRFCRQQQQLPPKDLSVRGPKGV